MEQESQTRLSPPLRVLLLGGFDVWHEGRPLRGFESQKVRALLAYLAVHRGRSFSRDHLAALLWPERDEETARRNLRQAIYNLKANLPEDDAAPLIVADAGSAELRAGPGAWVDVEAFSQALHLKERRGHEAASHDLVTAVNLYRGELMAGFYLKDSVEFEEWLAGEQERFRDAARGALRALVELYSSRAELRLGIQYARRLVAMDALSEEAHRDLMRLYALSGQRNRALAHYRDLRDLLARELGVEPLEETVELHESILREEVLEAAAAERGAPLRPVVPLVGRAAAIERLREHWAAVLDGRARITVVEGEPGIGKTRLIRSFIDGATARRPSLVLTGRCGDRFPDLPYRPFVQMLRQAFAGDGDEGGERAARLSAATRRQLVRLLPELGVPARAGGERMRARDDRGALFKAVADALMRAGEGDEPGARLPVVLFVDDVQWADQGTRALLGYLASHLSGAIWLLAGGRGDALAAVPELTSLAGRAASTAAFACVPLGRLTDEDVEQIAHALVPEAQAGELAAELAAGGGLPISVVALVNTLWDDGALAADSAASERWVFRPAAVSGRRTAADLKQLIAGRVRRLPASTRRIASIAAVAHSEFDAELLCCAEDEHAAVVEVGLEVLLDRWLIRQAPRRWNPAGLAAVVEPWRRGLHGGRFEFDSELIRRLVYEEVSPIRKPVLHGQVARALAALRPPGAEGRDELLAYHTLAAGDWPAAVEHLEAAARAAAARLAPENAAACLERARALAERQAAQADDRDEAARWRARAATLATKPA